MQKTPNCLPYFSLQTSSQVSKLASKLAHQDQAFEQNMWHYAEENILHYKPVV